MRSGSPVLAGQTPASLASYGAAPHEHGPASPAAINIATRVPGRAGSSVGQVQPMLFGPWPAGGRFQPCPHLSSARPARPGPRRSCRRTQATAFARRSPTCSPNRTSQLPPLAAPAVQLPCVARPGVTRAFPALSPDPAEPAPRAGLARWAFLPVQVAAVALGALVLLVRIGGRPSWQSVWAEDRGIYLPGALAH